MPGADSPDFYDVHSLFSGQIGGHDMYFGGRVGVARWFAILLLGLDGALQSILQQPVHPKTQNK